MPTRVFKSSSSKLKYDKVDNNIDNNLQTNNSKLSIDINNVNNSNDAIYDKNIRNLSPIVKSKIKILSISFNLLIHVGKLNIFYFLALL
jgi:hypothetical protein